MDPTREAEEHEESTARMLSLEDPPVAQCGEPSMSSSTTTTNAQEEEDTLTAGSVPNEDSVTQQRQRQQKRADYFYSDIPSPSPPRTTIREFSHNWSDDGATKTIDTDADATLDISTLVEEVALRMEIRMTCLGACERSLQRRAFALAQREKELANARHANDTRMGRSLDKSRQTLLWKEALAFVKRRHEPAKATVDEILQALDKLEKELPSTE